MADDAAWASLIRAFGDDVRTLRQLLGLSQQDVAGAAGLSQGAISRLEQGTHENIPLLSALRVVGALTTFAPLVNGVVPPRLSDLFTVARVLPTALTGPATPPSDPGLARLLAAYQALPEPRRALFVTIGLSLLDHLASDLLPPDDAPPSLVTG